MIDTPTMHENPVATMQHAEARLEQARKDEEARVQAQAAQEKELKDSLNNSAKSSRETIYEGLVNG